MKTGGEGPGGEGGENVRFRWKGYTSNRKTFTLVAVGEFPTIFPIRYAAMLL